MKRGLACALCAFLAAAGAATAAAGATAPAGGAAVPPQRPRLTAIETPVRPLAPASIEGRAAARAAPAPHRSAPSHHRRRRHGSPALERVRAANRAATQEPVRDLYAGALQTYPWSEGRLYRLFTAPERVSDIALQQGEALVSVAAGDTVRWVIGDTSSGAGASRRVHILVKPSMAGLSTNLLVATDRRVYHIQLESVAAGAMASIAWSYADDALLAVRGSEAASGPSASEPTLDAQRLDFAYRIEGDRVPWRPLRAFDDGRHVYIEFPPSLASSEAPPLFVLGDQGAAEIVNYRMRGRFYVVDRLFGAAELRLAGRKPKVVRIVRTDAAGRAGKGRHA